MQRCPNRDCLRAGDDLGTCGFTGNMCGTPVKVDSETDIVVHCADCDMTRAINVHDLLHSSGTRVDGCQRDSSHCRAVLLKV